MRFQRNRNTEKCNCSIYCSLIIVVSRGRALVTKWVTQRTEGDWIQSRCGQCQKHACPKALKAFVMARCFYRLSVHVLYYYIYCNSRTSFWVTRYTLYRYSREQRVTTENFANNLPMLVLSETGSFNRPLAPKRQNYLPVELNYLNFF